jgi:hypothetical protein
METASIAKAVSANSAAHEHILRPVSHLDVIRITIFGDTTRVTAAKTQLVLA